MKSIHDKYPIFEPNQVLSKSHLNDLVSYLDEQIRLTRANLIGIGIVCGLEFTLEVTGSASIIHLIKGCGVPSEGYLIVEQEDVDLVSYRPYTPPNEIDYPPWKNKAALNQPPFPLWELFPAGEPDTTPLNSPVGFLNDKVLLLFLELKKEGLRNCSPNECDDKGSEVSITVRRLLISAANLDLIIAEANSLAAGLTFTDLEAALTARLNLPDLRLPRFDVPNTGPVTSNQVLAAFQSVFTTGKLTAAVGAALSAAYAAFKPLVEDIYPTDPFTGFQTSFGFLDSAATTTGQVRFLQYYYDLFDDLIKGYDECRWKGAELMCSCCPPEGLFPRHLMLGKLVPSAGGSASVYRHAFLPSAASAQCEAEAKEFGQLFQRLVEMVSRFTITPIPQPTSSAETQIRITPTLLGDVSQSKKAIPYYYLQNGSPPLYQLWSPEKFRRHRANQNLGYQSNEFTPAPPSFVTDPLRFDLEPHNFLRVEGHLGRNYRNVLTRLLTLKTQYRLPIEIVALRTGAFDENQPVDLTKEECEFRDLEALYDESREELLSALAEGVMSLYETQRTGTSIPATKPKHPLLKKYIPNYQHGDKSIGSWYENHFASIDTRPYIDVDQDAINATSVWLTVFCPLFAGATDLKAENYPHIVSIYYLSKLAQAIPDSLNALQFADFENKYEDLLGLVRYFRSDLAKAIPADLTQFIPQEDLLDQFDQILFTCKLEPIRALHEEYVARIRKVKQKQFLSFFLRDHPGIQHKAGVPLGGTFIIVYHQDPEPLDQGGSVKIEDFLEELDIGGTKKVKSKYNKKDVTDAFHRMIAKGKSNLDPDFQLLVGALTGQIPEAIITAPTTLPAAEQIIKQAVDEMADGTVIADFYLPYLCCSNCSGVQFVLPQPPLGLAIEIDCTDENGQARATLTPTGGMPPMTYQLDGQPFAPLSGKVVVSTGDHTFTIRDSAGAESAIQTINVPAPLIIDQEIFLDDPATATYRITFSISGGTPPYTADVGTVAGSAYTGEPIATPQSSVTITDSKGCTVTKQFEHNLPPPCNLPCEGRSRQCAFRLWLQPGTDGAKYKSFSQNDIGISFTYEGEAIELENHNQMLKVSAAKLNNDFNISMESVVKKLNEAISKALINKFGEELGKNRLVLTYNPAATDPFSVLRIEYFVCEKFDITFEIAYIKPNVPFRVRVRYTNEPLSPEAPFGGAVFTLLDQEPQEIIIPAFDCSERNQCGDSVYHKLCEGPQPKVAITATRLDGPLFSFKGAVTNMNEGEIVAWIWDFSVGEPNQPFFVGPEARVTFSSPARIVRLTVITAKGCFGVAQIDLG